MPNCGSKSWQGRFAAAPFICAGEKTPQKHTANDKGTRDRNVNTNKPSIRFADNRYRP